MPRITKGTVFEVRWPLPVDAPDRPTVTRILATGHALVAMALEPRVRRDYRIRTANHWTTRKQNLDLLANFKFLYLHPKTRPISGRTVHCRVMYCTVMYLSISTALLTAWAFQKRYQPQELTLCRSLYAEALQATASEGLAKGPCQRHDKLR